MSAEPDDAALAWAGDEPSTPEAPVVTADRPATSSALLITYGVLGGVYLIYTLGWFITVQRNGYLLADTLSQLMFELGEALAVFAPLLWFAGVFLLTGQSKPIVRLLWLVAGLLVIVPWPYVVGV